MTQTRNPRARGIAALVLCLSLGLAGCATQEPTAPPVSQQPTLTEGYAVMADGFQLPLQQWAPAHPPKAVVLALHGFNDYRNAFGEVGPYLAERGITTYAYDQRGFGATANRGEWAGADAMISDAKTMAALLRERHPDTPLYVLGESMGGAVTLAASTRAQAVDAEGIILVAPAVWGRATMSPLKRAALWFGSTFLPRQRVSGGGLEIVPSDNIAMRRALGADPLVIKQTRIDAVRGLADLMDVALAAAPNLQQRSLILYGERDQVVPKQPTCRMISSLPDPQQSAWRLALYPQGYHMLTRDLQAQVVLEDIAAWILGTDGPLPSGQEARRDERAGEFCSGAGRTA
jgi:acylglycerol lipase